jgi:hypothetical protein
MEFSKGESVEWIVADRGHLILSRECVPASPVDVVKKATLTAFAQSSKSSSK